MKIKRSGSKGFGCKFYLSEFCVICVPVQVHFKIMFMYGHLSKSKHLLVTEKVLGVSRLYAQSTVEKAKEHDKGKTR